ncbi:hypothetical protein [Streptomyces sp. NPDC003247]|uniref:hypothetical protein n=1 Tax=Streptomyces sp. NPDC003247 TaxID=3364677 RepID=UPI0036BFA73C
MGDRGGEPQPVRGRGGGRRWVIAGGAAALTPAVVVGAVVARDGTEPLTAPHACHTAAHGTAPAGGTAATGGRTPAGVAPAADFDGDGHPDPGFGAAVRLVDMDGDHRSDLVVAAPGTDRTDGSAWLLPGTADGPATGGVTRLYGDGFDSTEGLDLYMGGGGIAH